MEKGRHVRRLFITDSLLLNVLRGDLAPGLLIPVDDPVPPDARVLDVRHDSWTQSLQLLIESETFSPVADGEVIPELRPTFRRETV